MKDYSIEELDLSKQGLTELPDLRKYTNLKKLNCSYNKLTHLDNLPINLTKLDCSNNPLTYDFIPTLENIRKYNKKMI